MIQKRPTRNAPGKKPAKGQAKAAGKKKVGKVAKTPADRKTRKSAGGRGKQPLPGTDAAAGAELELELDAESEAQTQLLEAAVAVAEAEGGSQDDAGDDADGDQGPEAEAAADRGESAESSEDADSGSDDGQDSSEPGDDAGDEVDAEAAAAALQLRVEALLFASGQALATRRLSKALKAKADDVRAALDALKVLWAERESAIELIEVSGGWRFMTRAAYHDDVARLAAKVRTEKLSPAALETLAVVAYRQPIGRADIESVRGVQCGPLLRVLLDRDLIRITGRSSEPGHPLQYGTTKRFLDHFGLASLKNLPDIKDLLNVS